MLLPRIACKTGNLVLIAAGFTSLAWFAIAPPVSLAQAAQAVGQGPEIHIKGDLSGNWQGTLQAGKSLRLVLKIARDEKGWVAKFFSIDQAGGQPINVTGVTVDGSAVKLTIPLIGGDYAGTLSADGTTMTGTWTQGATALPLTLVRAPKETAWEIPEPPAPVKTMAADADPSFDVATIKPNNSGAPGLQGLTVNGRNFAMRNASLGDLISFAFGIQTRQIVGAPDWLDKDRYDIAGVPDMEGAPSPAHIRIMLRKLLIDRFKLKFHDDKKDMSAYVLTIAKGGEKIKPTELSGPLPGIGFSPGKGGLTFNARNATMSDMTSALQLVVLDRPVVDQTGLKGKFDVTVTFTPDDSQFNGHPPPLPKSDSSTESAPTLFEAFQQQAGLKLEALKTAVDVIVIDRVEKPTAN